MRITDVLYRINRFLMLYYPQGGNGMKPRPYKWILTSNGIVEVFDFAALCRRNPPPYGYNTPVIPFPCGYFKKGCWVSR